MKINTLSLFWTSTLCVVLVYTQMLPDETKDVVEGENIRLPCRFSPSFATRSIQYYWKRSNKNGTDVAAIKEVSFNAEHYGVEFAPEEGRYDLVITRVEYETDNGKFECKLKEGGSGNDIFVQVFIVTVLIPPGPPIVEPNNPSAREGEPFDLTCSSRGGSPDPVIQWHREGVLVHGQVKNGESRDKPTINVLTINPGMDDDGITYRCTVWNRAIREEQEMMATVKLSVHYAPRVTVGPYNPLNILTGQDAHLTCSAVANPPVRSIKWMKNDQLLSTSPNHTITAVTHEDSGQYVCSVDNGLGLSSEAILELSVLYGPKVTVEPLREAKLGESVTVACKVDSNPTPHSVQWLKVDDAFFRQTGDILRLIRVTIHDTGKYACKASNMLRPSGSITQKEMSSSGIVQIVIKHKPGIATIFPINPVATSGTPFTLSCVANPEGWPQPEFRWWRAGQENVVLGRSVNYTILPVHISHEGEYFCQAENSLGLGMPSSVYLTVQEPPSILLSLRPQVVMEDGDEGFSITCKARGKPKPLVRWLRNGKEITDNSDFFRVDTTSRLEDNDAFSVQSTLYFDGPQKRRTSLSPTDRGHYSCVFKNGVEEPVRSEMNLRIKHSPIVRHTYNKVAFDVSETAILQCKMQAYPLPSFEWFFKGRIVDNYGSYSTNVTDLGDDIYVGILSINDIRASDFGDYTCRAWNQVGDDEKTIIKLVTKSAPDRPSMLEVVDINFDRVTLQWSEGFNGGFSNTEFLVTYINLETMQTKNESCRSHNPCQITGLQSKTEYNFKVMAVNPRGYSPYSDEISVNTKVNIKDMPRATDAQYNRDTSSLSFIVDSKMLKLVAKIEARVQETDKWRQQELLKVEQKKSVVYLRPPQDGFSDVRVILCLQSNESWCGDEKLAEPFIANCNEAKISEYEGQQQYYMGFQQCMHETTKFLTEMNGIFSGDNLRVQLVHHLRKYYNKLCEGTHYQTAGIIRSPLSTKNTFEISMDTDCYSPSSTPSDEPQSNSSLGIARYYQPSRQVTLESGKQFSLKAANTSRGITDGLPQTGSLSSQPSQLVESVTENQKSFQFRKVPQNPEHPLKHFHKSSENVGTKNVYPFLSTPHLSPRGNSHGLHKGEEVYKFKKNIKERFTANQQQHMSPTEDSSSPEHLNYNSEPLCGDWHSPLNPHRSIEHSYTHLTPSMLYRHNDNILSMKATEKDCPENDLVSTGLWDNSRSSTVIKFNGSSSNNISYSTVDTCSSNSSSCGFNPSSSSFVRSNGSSSSISGYSTGSDVASYMSKHIIHSPQKDIPLPYSNNRPPMQASGVPIFALHPKGTFYIPLTLDIGLLSPFLNNLGNSVPVLHPVNISVSFGTRSS